MWERFRYWFSNVFWYHYRVQALAIVIGLGVLIVMIAEMTGHVKNDLSYVMVSDDAYLDISTGELMEPYLLPVLKDAHNDGELHTFCDALWLTTSNTNYYVEAQKFMLTFMDEAYLLYIVFESSVPRMLDDENIGSSFINAAELGYSTHEKADWLADISGGAIWRDMGLGEDVSMYAAVRTLPQKDDPELKIAHENALRVLAMLGNPDGAVLP